MTGVRKARIEGEQSLGGLPENQELTMDVSSLDASCELGCEVSGKREADLYLVDGKICMADFHLTKGDAVKVTRERHIQIQAGADSEIVLFDVPPNE